MGGLLDVGFGNALMAAGLAVLAAILGRSLRRPALTHGLWLLVLLKLIAPPMWSVEVANSWRSEVPASAAPVVEEIDVEATIEFVEVVAIDEVEPSVTTEVETRWSPRAIAGAIWLTGSLIWSASAILRIRRFQRVLRLAEPAPQAIQELAAGLAARIGLARSPEVRLVPGAVSPLVWAVGGPPLLLVPRDLWITLDRDGRSTLLTHELAHLRRRDHWVRWVELTATAFYWWCPILWWARRELREAEEQCCDAWVVWAWPEATKAYATALLETVDFLASTRPSVPLAASGAGHVHHLKRRVTMILRGLTPKSLSTPARALMFGLAALLLPLVPTSAEDKPKTDVSKPRGDVEADIKVKVEVAKTDDDDDDDDKAERKEKQKAGREVKEEKKDRKEGDADKKKEEPRRERRIEIRTERREGQKEGGDRPEARRQPSKEDLVALDKARAEMRETQQQLMKAAHRLAELERKIHGASAGPMRIELHRSRSMKPGEGKEGESKEVYLFDDAKDGGPKPQIRINGRVMSGPHGPGAPQPPVPPGAPQPPMPPGSVGLFRQGMPGQMFMMERSRVSENAGASEKRIVELEKKLDMLLKEIKEMKAKQN